MTGRSVSALQEDLVVLVGTYTRDTQSKGIYQLRIDGEAPCIAQTDNPSYLAKHPNLDILYCVNEHADSESTVDLGGANNVVACGTISAYDLGRKHQSEELSLILRSQQPSMGADPCHLTIAENGSYIVVCNYTGGSFSTYRLNPDGQFESLVGVIQQSGQGPNKDRQSSAHAHSSHLYGDQTQVLIADLGSDRIFQYRISRDGNVNSTPTRELLSKPGSGPRFMATSEDQLFVLNELDNTLASYSLPDLTPRQVISVVPDDSEISIAAHLAISQDHQYLYVSNRGFDTIAVVQIQPNLELIQTIASGGKHPRHFALVNQDSHMLVANLESNNVTVFERRADTGLLTKTGESFTVPAPTCLLPVPGYN